MGLLLPHRSRRDFSISKNSKLFPFSDFLKASSRNKEKRWKKKESLKKKRTRRRNRRKTRWLVLLSLPPPRLAGALALLAASFGILLFSDLVHWTVCEYHVRVDFLDFSFLRPCASVHFRIFFSAPVCAGFFGLLFSAEQSWYICRSFFKHSSCIP